MLFRSAVGATLDTLLKYVDKNPKENLLKLITLGEKLLGGTFPQSSIEAARKAVAEGESNVYYKLAMNMLKDVDRGLLKKLLLSMGLGAGVKGTKAVRENRDKCNIPFLMLMDPTSACNMKCKGCWSAEYGHKNSLTYEEMHSIVR